MPPSFDEQTGLLLEAIQFSADRHRNQRRKDDTHTPYINHPIAVTRRLWDIGDVRDPTTLISAVLHDTIEDTITSPDEILSLFGKEVYPVVLEVADDKTLPKLVRKQLQIEHAPFITTQAKLIKLADKSCNLYDLIVSPPLRWSLKRRQNYLLWTEKVVAGLRGINNALETKYDEILQDGKRVLELI